VTPKELARIEPVDRPFGAEGIHEESILCATQALVVPGARRLAIDAKTSMRSGFCMGVGLGGPTA
jgi:hypothetical protein